MIFSRPALLLALTPAVLCAQADQKTVYEAAVGPILSARCVYCHGAEKQKGDIRLDSAEQWVKAGESEKPAIVPGKSAESYAIHLVNLGEGEDDHMPPKSKPQLSAEEKAVLVWWVDAGARTDVKIADAGLPEDLKAKVLAIAANPPKAPEAAAPAPPAAAPGADPKDATVLQVEKDLGVTIVPLAQNDPGLTFTCVNIADKFGDAELAKLGPIGAKLTDVNLARSKVTDAGLATLGTMSGLRRLRLENTAVTDAGIDHLLGLGNLEYLNLFNTKITDAGLARLEKLKKLKKLYVWQTGVTEEGAKKLHGQLPEIVINLGWDKEVKTAAAPPPPPAPPPAPAKADPEQPVYAALIQPIFNSKCTGCHGAEKQKGKLRMDSLEELLKGGDSADKEKTIVAGKSGESSIVKRIQLPHDNDEHMPPEDKEQLTEKELKTLIWWIDSGAKADVKLKDAGLPAELQ